MRWFPRDNATVAHDPRFAEPPPTRPVAGPGPLTRFLGGSPLGVALRLILLSVLVGALMVWLNIHPEDVLSNARRFVEHVWATGFDAFREAGKYLLVGAVIVIPVFLLMRLLSYRRPH